MISYNLYSLQFLLVPLQWNKSHALHLKNKKNTTKKNIKYKKKNQKKWEETEKRTGQHWCESDWISQQLKQNHVVSHQQGIQDSFSQSELRESENQNGQSATQTEWRRSQRSSFDKDGSQKIQLSFRTRKKEDWSDSERGEWLFQLIHWAFTTLINHLQGFQSGVVPNRGNIE